VRIQPSPTAGGCSGEASPLSESPKEGGKGKRVVKSGAQQALDERLLKHGGVSEGQRMGWMGGKLRAHMQKHLPLAGTGYIPIYSSSYPTK
jgi:hypothetical protein